jgi:hypothetical protein
MPLRCRFFAWLALRNRCWTSDRLARRGLDHQEACPFCDQAEESIDHILVQCVLAREVWNRACTAMNKQDWVPTGATRLIDWCTSKGGNDRGGKDIRALILLVMWELWKHRNAIVFDGATPSVESVIHRIEAESRSWKSAGIIKADMENFLVALTVGSDVRS